MTEALLALLLLLATLLAGHEDAEQGPTQPGDGWTLGHLDDGALD